MTRPIRVLTIDRVSPAAIARLAPDMFEIGPEVMAPDAVLVRSTDMHSMELPESVRAVGRAGVGVNNIPIGALSRRGVPVFNAPGANANAVKELVVAGMLLGARRIVPAWEFARGLAGDDATISAAVEAGKKRFVGFELPGRLLGVAGLGAIGVEVANAALALGCRVIGFDPALSVARAWQLSSGVRQAANLDELFRGADFVTVHVPLDDTTRGLVSAERIATMAEGAVLLNFAREQVVDAAAVVAALDRGKLSAFVTDFPTAALKDHPAVTALPHLGASTLESEENSVTMVLENLRSYFEEGTVRHSVNFPDAVVPPWHGDRLAVVNANIPGMVGRISMELAAAGLNIAEMVNASRGELAYTLVDVAGQVPEATLDTIAAMSGVLAARVHRGRTPVWPSA